MIFAIILIKGDVNTSNYRQNASTHIFLDILLTSIFLILLSTICCLLTYIIKNGSISFPYNTFQIDTKNTLSALPSLLLTILLLLLKSNFCMIFISVINFKSNLPMGFFVLLFTVIDRWFYEVLNIYQPLGFTLLEHSTIFYSEAVAPTSNDATRISFYVSLAVWIILISLFTALILLQQQSLVRSIRGKHNAK